MAAAKAGSAVCWASAPVATADWSSFSRRSAMMSKNLRQASTRESFPAPTDAAVVIGVPAMSHRRLRMDSCPQNLAMD